MAVKLEIDRRICYHVTKLAVLCAFCFTFSATTPTHGFELLNVRGLTKQKYNNTIEIAVFVPEHGLSKNECCPLNETTCGREGTECQCQQQEFDCVCICPTDNFPLGFHFDKDDCCPSNNTYCKRHGDDCDCEQNDSGCQCVCPSELDYTVRLVAGIAIVLLIGVTVMLVISLYRRAVLSRRRRRSEGGSISSDISSRTNPEPPPRYADVYLISSPKVVDADTIDFEKLPSYEEALSLQVSNGSVAQAHTSMDEKIIEGVNTAVVCIEQESQMEHPLDSPEAEMTDL